MCLILKDTLTSVNDFISIIYISNIYKLIIKVMQLIVENIELLVENYLK